MKEISVILALYNGEKFIEEQLDSILNQSILPNEIIIVDDFSTDNSVKIINNYILQYPQILLLQNSVNLGVVLTFEKALSHASGHYIFFSDQDDVWFPNKIETMINMVGDNWLIFSDSMMVDTNLKSLNHNSFSHFELSRSFTKTFDYLIGNNIPGCSMMITRELLNKALPFPKFRAMYHDQYFAILAKATDKLKRVDLPLLFYRQHSKNASGSINNNGYIKFLETMKLLASDLDLLQNNSFFRLSIGNAQDLNIAKEYYLAIAHTKYPSIISLFNILKLLPLKMWFWFLRIACLGSEVAKLNFYLASVKLKFKILMNKK